MASVSKDISRTIAHLPGVAAEVRTLGRRMGELASAHLAQHATAHPGSRIEVTQTGTDVLVELVDEGEDGDAVAIEFGRGAYTTKSGRKVGAMEALHILTDAMNAV